MASPKLTPDQIAQVSGLVAQYISTQRDNSFLLATTITGRGHTVEALPLARTTEILKKYGAIK
jgi:hypothetical protein